MTSEATAIGVDIGGSKMMLGLLHADQRISNQIRIITEKQDPDWIMQSIVDYARENGAGLPVGVAANGSVDKKGVVRFGTYIPWNGYPLAEKLEQELGVPTFVQNDATVAAWGEYILDPLRRSVVAITVGTGVGGGAVVESKLLVGRGAAMEIGHLPVKKSTRKCVCGKMGCLEALASGSAVAARYQERRRKENPTEELLMYTAHSVVSAAQLGDSLAIEILQEAGAAIGEAAAVITSILDPDRVVLTGGLIQGAGELILQTARSSFREHLAMPNLSSTNILEKSSAPVDPIIWGAGALAAKFNGKQ